MAEEDKKEIHPDQVVEEIEEKTEEPWRAIMANVGEIVDAALDMAHSKVIKYFGCADPIPKEAIIRLAACIFEATAQAEAGRRMVEAQKERDMIPQLKGGRVIQVGADGKPIRG